MLGKPSQDKPLTLIRSNSLDGLKNVLHLNLTRSKKFRRILVTPSSFIKEELQKHLSTAQPFSFYSEQKTMEQLYFLLFNKKVVFPTQKNLLLLIHHFLSGERTYSKTQVESLSLTLSKIFFRYFYAFDEVEKAIAKDPLQTKLWLYLTRSLFHPWELCQENARPIDIDMEFHFFAVQSPSKLLLNLLKLAAPFCPIYFYSITPSRHFIGDFLSQKEAHALLEYRRKEAREPTQIDALEELLLEMHPLVANWSGALRAENKNFDALQTHEIDLMEEPQKDSVLLQLQSDIFHLEQSEHRGVDESIALHQAPNRMREVEVILQEITRLMMTQKELAPSDFLILTPHIDLYFPYIKAVFGDSPFSYRIHGLSAKTESPLSHALQQFFDLIEGRWEKRTLTSLFSLPSFYEAAGFDSQEIEQILQWIDHVDIRWGFNQEHKQKILQESSVSFDGSWESGFATLLSGLCTEHPIDIELSKADLLGRFIACMRELFADLTSLAEQSLPLMSWIKTLQDLLEKYFNRQLPSLLSLQDLATQLQEEEIRYATIALEISSLLSAEKMTYHHGESLPLSFAPLHVGHLSEKKVLISIGMTETAFPQQEIPSSLDRFQQKVKRQDEDRLLFLGLITHAKEKLIFTYIATNPDDGGELGPSLLIRELEKELGDLPLQVHSPLPFHESYFTKQNYQQQKTFALAQKYYAPKNPAQPGQLTPPTSSLLWPQEIEIPTYELFKLSKNPFQFYCNASLGLHLEQVNQARHPHEGEFILSYLNKAILRRSLLHTFSDDAITPHAKLGSLPLPPFQTLAKKELTKEIEEIQHHLQGARPLILHLDPQCQTSFTPNGTDWIFPAITIQVGKHTRALIHGRIDGFTTKGLLTLGRSGFAEKMKAYPKLLLVEQLKDPLPFPRGSLIFGREGKEEIIDLSHTKQLLKLYLEFYLQAQTNLVPLHPTWAESLICESEKEFAKSFHQTKRAKDPFPDPYLLWARSRGIPLEPERIYTDWHSYLHDVHLPLINTNGCCHEA